MKWQVHHVLKEIDKNARVSEILDVLLKNRGISDSSDIEQFISPQDPYSINLESVGIDKKALKKTIARIEKAIQKSEKILIFGDYDADGVTATAILWEALIASGAKAIPFIPNRERHGYGLSVKALEEALTRNPSDVVITVDNGITAVPAADWLKAKGIDLLITDHHQRPIALPDAQSILHTDKISGAGIAWFLARELHPYAAKNSLDLVTIGSIADQMPMVGPNRSLVKHGLIAIKNTNRPGLTALLAESQLEPDTEITTYHVNYIIAPRINATGRLEDAMDSLRLLCTKNVERAKQLADTLGTINRTRQDLTTAYIDKAIALVGKSKDLILVVDDPDFHEGVVGLVAGKLAEKFSRPAIVIARGSEVSKASARSIPGINIIELLRIHSDELVGVGGHPMAAGLSIRTKNIAQFKEKLLESAAELIHPSMLESSLAVDCEVNLDDVGDELYAAIEKLKPFGLGNPEPVFSIQNATITATKFVGKTSNHLQFTFKDRGGRQLKGIRFNCPGILTENITAVASTIQKNRWNGREYLQLRILDCL